MNTAETHYGLRRRGLPPWLRPREAGQLPEDRLPAEPPPEDDEPPTGPPAGAGTRNAVANLEVVDFEGNFWAQNPQMGNQWQLVYRIEGGDFLSGIADRFYGSAAEWRRIWEVPQNRAFIPNPDEIWIGDRILIPDLEDPLVGDPGQKQIDVAPPNGRALAKVDDKEGEEKFWTPGKAAAAAGLGTLAVGGTAWWLMRRRRRR